MQTGAKYYHLQEESIRLLQLRDHVETEKLERNILNQLIQRLKRDFTLLQPQLDPTDQPSTIISISLATLKNRERSFE